MRAVVAGGYLARLDRLEAKLAFAMTKWADYRTLELYPSIEQLAKSVGSRNLRRVRDALTRLEEMGLTETTHRGGGRGKATTRRLIVPPATEPAEQTETQAVPVSASKQGQLEQLNRDSSDTETGTVSARKGGHAPSPPLTKKRANGTLHEHTTRALTPDAAANKSAPECGSKRSKLTLAEAKAIEIPLSVDTPTFRVTWEQFLQYRDERGELGMRTGTQVLLNQLAAYGPEEAIARLNRTMANQWRGVLFPDDRRNGVNNGKGKHHSGSRRIEEKLSA
jgi:hypothetical protein